MDKKMDKLPFSLIQNQPWLGCPPFFADKELEGATMIVYGEHPNSFDGCDWDGKMEAPLYWAPLSYRPGKWNWLPMAFDERTRLAWNGEVKVYKDFGTDREVTYGKVWWD